MRAACGGRRAVCRALGVAAAAVLALAAVVLLLDATRVRRAVNGMQEDRVDDRRSRSARGPASRAAAPPAHGRRSSRLASLNTPPPSPLRPAPLRPAPCTPCAQGSPLSRLRGTRPARRWHPCGPGGRAAHAGGEGEGEGGGCVEEERYRREEVVLTRKFVSGRDEERAQDAGSNGSSVELQAEADDDNDGVAAAATPDAQPPLPAEGGAAAPPPRPQSTGGPRAKLGPAKKVQRQHLRQRQGPAGGAERLALRDSADFCSYVSCLCSGSSCALLLLGRHSRARADTRSRSALIVLVLWLFASYSPQIGSLRPAPENSIC